MLLSIRFMCDGRVGATAAGRPWHSIDLDVMSSTRRPLLSRRFMCKRLGAPAPHCSKFLGLDTASLSRPLKEVCVWVGGTTLRTEGPHHVREPSRGQASVHEGLVGEKSPAPHGLEGCHLNLIAFELKPPIRKEQKKHLAMVALLTFPLD